jgi:aspartyl-tRNA(Asn)/glutamyl-tRNA(Gln) amidotransferase subunit C
MSVDQKTVRRIAHLARLRLAEEDVPRMEGELNAILKWIEQLNEVDVSGVEPLTSVVATKMKKRKDEVTDGGIPKHVTGNAPAAEDELFTVPKVVE